MILLQVHTFEMTHKISAREVKDICKKFNVAYTANVHINSPPIAGIKNIYIKRNPVYKNGTWVSNIHTITIEVNVGRLLKLSNVSMIELSRTNVQAMFNKLDIILSGNLCLHSQNSISADWIISRLDCGLDVKMGTDDRNTLKEHMRLLHKTFNPANSRGYDYTTYHGYDEPHVMYESITLNNTLYKYNIYYKVLELEKKYGNKLLAQDMNEIKDVIRVEKQMEGKSLTNALGSPRKMSLLLDENIVSRVMDTIINDMILLFGGGIHLTYDAAMKTINSSKYSDDVKLNLKLLYANIDTFGYTTTIANLERLASSHGADKKTITTMKTLIEKRRKQIETLGIATAGLNNKVVQLTGALSLMNINDSIQNMIKAKAARRSKGSFCRFFYDAPNKRYKCNPSLYGTNGKQRVSIAGKTQEVAEMNVLYKIREFLNANLRMHKNNDAARKNSLMMSRQDVEKFKTVIDRPEMLAILDDVLNQLNSRIDKMDAEITKDNIKEEQNVGEESL